MPIRCLLRLSLTANCMVSIIHKTSILYGLVDMIHGYDVYNCVQQDWNNDTSLCCLINAFNLVAFFF